jgi:hypothetical protein
VGNFNSISISIKDTHNVTVTRAYAITINDDPTLNATALPDGAYKTAYSTTLAISGGTAPFSSLSVTGLPTGVTASLTAATGVIKISGTPTAAGDFTPVISVKDAAGVAVATTGGSFSLHIAGAATKTTLTSSSASWAIGQAITFTAAVSTPGTNAGAPNSGTVTFYVDGNAATSKTVTSTGIASVSYTFTSGTTLGSHSVYAVYTPTIPNFQASTSNTVTQSVLNSTSVSLHSSATTVTLGATVTFTATVASPAGAPTSGSISFYDGTRLLQTLFFSGSSTVTFKTSSLSATTHSITAVYNGDGQTYYSARSAAVAVTVKGSRVR